MEFGQFEMPDGHIILASASQTRQEMLKKTHLSFHAHPSYIDEEAIKYAALQEDMPHDDIVILLAELKAQQLASQDPGYVLGCDQVLVCEEKLFSKPANIEEAKETLAFLSGKTHNLLTAIIVFHQHKRIWHHLAKASLHMRVLSPQDIDDYCLLYADHICHSPGSYQIENGGAHLFHKIDGDYYDILGLPLLPLLSFLRTRGLSRVTPRG